jgi:ribosome-associated protein
MSKATVRQQVAIAAAACSNKKAEDLVILELEKGASAFTDYFVVCSGSNPRQLQAISDEVEQQLAQAGVRPNQVEGYNQAEWVLLDFVDFVVHVFSATARKFYDLERLWKSAKRLTLSDLQRKETRPTAAKAKKPAKARSSAKPSTAKKRSLRVAATPAKRKTVTKRAPAKKRRST